MRHDPDPAVGTATRLVLDPTCTDRDHHKVSYLATFRLLDGDGATHNADQRFITIPKTPSSQRSLIKFESKIRRAGGEWPPGRRRMTEYVITAGAYAPDVELFVDPDSYADALMDAAADYDGVVEAASHRWELAYGITATHLVDAMTQAWVALEKITQAAAPHLPFWEVQDMRATLESIIEFENDQPNAPDLVSGPEAAEILGVSKARVHQLAKEHRDFPKPLYVLAAGSLWTRSAVEAFEARWDRTPGRPRKVAPPSEMPVQPGAEQQNAANRAELARDHTSPKSEKAR